MKHVMRTIVVSAFLAIPVLTACSKPIASPGWPETPVFDVQKSSSTVLEVSGLVNGGAPAYFTLEQLRALPKTEFSSADPWIPGVTRYGGFALYPFLKALRISEDAKRVVLTAKNDYTVGIDIESIRTHRYLITYEENGKLYSEFPDDRNKGPVSIAVPHEELSGVDMGVLKLNYVWWLETIRVTE